MLSNIGSTEIIIIALVILVLFGGKRIPEFVRSMGDAVREFRRAVKDDEDKTNESK
ncbi:MAG: twin-arginine translocase TatA/TatE family subunit [Phototrophicales bacterium]|nr:MAG: twin-arginine translocase TatA/TatE family subunit [Phototrophicales bacterium]